MKKSLIALAVLGAFAGAASAQSSVTVYGRLNLGLVKEEGQTARIDQFGNGANRLGFRGVEDLGNGLKGTFNMEHRFAPESGGLDGNNNGRPFWQGTAKVGLTHGSFGSVEIGRMLTAFQAPINATDPWGTETVASVAVLTSGYATDPRAVPTATGDNAGAGRTDVITYTSPKLFGATASFSWGPERSAGVPGIGNAAAGTANAKDLYSLWLGYTLGPLAIGGGYEQNRNDDNAAAVLASYDLGFAKVMGGYSRTDAAATIGGAQVRRDNFNVGTIVPMGSFNLKAGFSRSEVDAVGGVETDKIGIGAEYLLSKRTYLYTNFSNTDISGGAAAGKTDRFDFGVNHNF